MLDFPYDFIGVCETPKPRINTGYFSLQNKTTPH
jgi:hypothetical protein